MNVLITWSGQRSCDLARVLHEWLPRVLQTAETWIEPGNLQTVADWRKELGSRLQKTRVGIVCLTPESVNSPWILHETGALWAHGSEVILYLLGFGPGQLTGPLAQFEAVQATIDGTQQLVRTVNSVLGHPGV